MDKKPVIVLVFARKAHEDEFLRLYGAQVLSTLRMSANECPLARTLRFELPPSKNDPLEVYEEEIPHRYVIFDKVRESEQERWEGKDGEPPPSFWTYQFRGIE